MPGYDRPCRIGRLPRGREVKKAFGRDNSSYSDQPLRAFAPRRISMKISRVVLAAAVMTAILTGCETPAVMTPAPDVDNAKTLNRVQVRDDSALYNDMTRGGAAMRSDEISQVLFNEHHRGDGIDRPEGPVSVADKNASDKSAKDSGKASAMNDAIAGKTTAKKDRSVYAPLWHLPVTEQSLKRPLLRQWR